LIITNRTGQAQGILLVCIYYRVNSEA